MSNNKKLAQVITIMAGGRACKFGVVSEALLMSSKQPLHVILHTTAPLFINNTALFVRLIFAHTHEFGMLFFISSNSQSYIILSKINFQCFVVSKVCYKAKLIYYLCSYNAY